MPHPIVQQLRFTRSEFQRAVTGITPEEAARHEVQAIRQLLGHTGLPSFVGAIGDKAPFVAG